VGCSGNGGFEVDANDSTGAWVEVELPTKTPFSICPHLCSLHWLQSNAKCHHRTKESSTILFSMGVEIILKYSKEYQNVTYYNVFFVKKIIEYQRKY